MQMDEIMFRGISAEEKLLCAGYFRYRFFKILEKRKNLNFIQAEKKEIE